MVQSTARWAGNEDVVDDGAARAGTLHPHHLPIVENGELPALHQNVHGNGTAVRARALGAADEMGRDVAARGVIPAAARPPAARDRRAGDGGADGRGAKLAILAIGLELRRVGEYREDEGMSRGQRQDPAARRTAARNLDHHPQKGGHVEFIPAEAARLHDPVKAGADEGVVGLGQDRAGGFAGGLARAQEGPHRHGAGDHRLWRQRRLGRRYRGRGIAAGARFPVRRHVFLRLFFGPSSRQ
jgi:hypothetical protein